MLNLRDPRINESTEPDNACGLSPSTEAVSLTTVVMSDITTFQMEEARAMGEFLRLRFIVHITCECLRLLGALGIEVVPRT